MHGILRFMEVWTRTCRIGKCECIGVKHPKVRPLGPSSEHGRKRRTPDEEQERAAEGGGHEHLGERGDTCDGSVRRERS